MCVCVVIFVCFSSLWLFSACCRTRRLYSRIVLHGGAQKVVHALPGLDGPDDGVHLRLGDPGLPDLLGEVLQVQLRLSRGRHLCNHVGCGMCVSNESSL